MELKKYTQRAIAFFVTLSLLNVSPVLPPALASSPNELDDICNQAASGGTIKAITIGANTFCRHTFDEVGSSTFTVRDSRITRVDYLVVAGGGGGAGRDVGGGGGAGGLVSNLKPVGTSTSGLTVSANSNIRVDVGAGGAGLGDISGTGGTGGPSTLGVITAAGGGGGGYYTSAGSSGGSGGGSGRESTVQAAATSNQGNLGGQGKYAPSSGNGGGGGGGGAGAPGSAGSDSRGGDGGAGLDYSGLFGTDLGGDSGRFAGGGAGAAHRTGGNPITSGAIGGGGGESGGGKAATGGGGGASRGVGLSGGNGGSGIVVVRYTLPTPMVVLPASTQQARIGAGVLVKDLNSRNLGAISPKVNGLGGSVTTNISTTFGEVAIRNLNGATATGYSAGNYVSTVSISGTATQVNAALETLEVKSSAEGLATLSVSASDSPRANSASAQTIIYFSGSEIVVPSTAVSGERGQWLQVTGANLSGFAQNVTVTIDSNQSGNVKLRLQDLIATSPGQITAPQTNLSSFSKDSSGAATIVINGPVNQVNNALASLQVWADDPSSARVTIQASAGDGQVFEGNGHTYRIVRLNRGITWMDAFAAAAATKIPASGGGYCQGYLVTVTSEAERRFVNSKVGGQLVWLGASDQSTDRIVNDEHLSYVVAAHRLNGDDDATAESKAKEGDFFWVTGPERGRLLSSGNWRGSARPVSNQNSVEGYIGINGTRTNYPWGNGEPNNFKLDDPGEDFGHILSNGNWNDFSWKNGSVRAFVIEYGGIKATEGHKSYAGAPLGTPKALQDFEKQIDQNLTDPDYVGVKQPCLGVSADTNKSASFTLDIFKTPEPTATIGNVTGVAYTPSASNQKTDLTLNADVVLDGATISSIGFEYVVSQSIGSDFSGATTVPATLTSGSNYKADLAGLDNDRYVNYRLVVSFTSSNPNITIPSVTSSSASVRTLASPTVNTGNFTLSNFVNNNSFTITLEGLINANNVGSGTTNNITAAAFLVSESASLANPTRYPLASSLPTGSADVSVSKQITDLVAGKEYFYALEATNIAGTNIGSIRSFFVAGVPSISAQPAIFNSDGSITLTGSINPNFGSLSDLQFELNTNPTSDTRLLELTAPTDSGNSPLSFSFQVNDLIPGDYSFRLLGENNIGPSQSQLLTFSIANVQPPTNLRSVSIRAREVSISWLAPSSGAPVSGYEVYLSDDCVRFEKTPDVFLTAGTHNIGDLRPETQYCVKVLSASIVGDSVASDVYRFTTLSLAAEAPTISPNPEGSSDSGPGDSAKPGKATSSAPAINSTRNRDQPNTSTPEETKEPSDAPEDSTSPSVTQGRPEASDDSSLLAWVGYVFVALLVALVAWRISRRRTDNESGS